MLAPNKAFVYMKEILLAEMDDMLRVLLSIEEPTFPHIDLTRFDHDLLEFVAGACDTIGPQIAAAFEGEQRRVFQELCLQIAREGIQYHPSVPDAARSNLTSLMVLSTLGAGCLFVLVSSRLIYRRIRRTPRRN